MTVQIITRAEWGAVHPAGFGPAPPASELWLHHSVTRSAGVQASANADVATVRELERIGQERFGGGISYTLVVCASGRVFEGTGPLRRGSHTGGRNTVARAICLLGNHAHTRPSDPALAAVAELVVHGYREHWWTMPALSGGHRNAPGAQTECPGDAAQACVPLINKRADQIMRDLIDGSPEEDDVTFTEDDRRKLDVVHSEVTKRLANRRGTGGQTIPGGGDDTVLGYSTNADGFGFRTENTLHSLILAVGQANERLAEIDARLTRLEGTP